MQRHIIYQLYNRFYGRQFPGLPISRVARSFFQNIILLIILNKCNSNCYSIFRDTLYINCRIVFMVANSQGYQCTGLPDHFSKHKHFSTQIKRYLSLYRSLFFYYNNLCIYIISDSHKTLRNTICH